MFFIGFFALLQCALGLSLILGQSPQAMQVYAALVRPPFEKTANNKTPDRTDQALSSFVTASNNITQPTSVIAP